MTDVMRYYVLYEFGGVYLDMDVVLVQPIYSILRKGYPCILSEEHPIQVCSLNNLINGNFLFYSSTNKKHYGTDKPIGK